MGAFSIRFVTLTSTLVGWLILLPPGVGWYIMEYESEPLPSYPELRNCSYYFKLIKPYPRLLLRFIYRILLPPLHQLARLRHLPRLHGHFIDGGGRPPSPLWSLTPLDVQPDEVDPHGFHCLHYRGYSHSPLVLRFAVIPVILCAAWWRNPARILSISLVTTQLSLSYNVTNCTTALYIAPRARTVGTVLSISLVPLCTVLSVTIPGTYSTRKDVKVPFFMPEFSSSKIISHHFHVDNNESESGIGYYTIIDINLMVRLGLSTDFKR